MDIFEVLGDTHDFAAITELGEWSQMLRRHDRSASAGKATTETMWFFDRNVLNILLACGLNLNRNVDETSKYFPTTALFDVLYLAVYFDEEDVSDESLSLIESIS